MVLHTFCLRFCFFRFSVLRMLIFRLRFDHVLCVCSLSACVLIEFASSDPNQNAGRKQAFEKQHFDFIVFSQRFEI